MNRVTGIGSLTALEAVSPKSSYGQDRVPSAALGKNLLCFFQFPVVVMTLGVPLLISALSSRGFRLCVSPCGLIVRTQSLNSGPTLMQYGFILTNIFAW